MLKKGMKKSVISKKLGVNRKAVYNWSVKLKQSGDWHDRKHPSSKGVYKGQTHKGSEGETEENNRQWSKIIRIRY